MTNTRKPGSTTHSVLNFTPSAEDRWQWGLTNRYCQQRKQASAAELMDVAARERQERFVERGRDRPGPDGALSHIHADHSAGLLSAARTCCSGLARQPELNLMAIRGLANMWGWRIDRACIGLAQLLDDSGASVIRVAKFKAERAASRAAFQAHLRETEARWGRKRASDQDALTAMRLYAAELDAIAGWCDEAKQHAVANTIRQQLAEALAAMQEAHMLM